MIEIAAGVAGESAEVVTGIMTETGAAEAEEDGTGRAEAGGETGIMMGPASVPPRMSSSRLQRMSRESEKGNLTWSFLVSESGGSVPQMFEVVLFQRSW